MPRFILFDIDSTLVDSGGAGRAALNLTLEQLTGIADGFKDIKFAGKTDPLLVREAFDLWGIALMDGMMAEFLKIYLAHLEKTILKGNGSIKPGVTLLLEKIFNDHRMTLGLLTGNIVQGARLKLEPHSLNKYFSLGAFGDDSEDRNKLLPIAVRRLGEVMGISAGYQDCIVIGDTPKDVDAAQVHGAKCIAVATGPYSVEALQETTADLVVSDLSNTEELFDWLISES